MSEQVTGDRAYAAALLAEIEDLMRWKAEAIEVLRRWDAVADTVELVDPCPLGHWRSDHVLRFVERTIVNPRT